MAVGDSYDVLFDDWAFVELCCDVVCGGADEFDAAFEGSAVGVCADECGEERVVDVDYFVGIACDEICGEDLHVSGEDDDISLAFHEFEHGVFGGDFVAERWADGDVMEGHAEMFDGLAQIGMVADDHGDVGFEITAFPAPEEFHERVVDLGTEDDHLFWLPDRAEGPVHDESVGDFVGEFFAEGVEARVVETGQEKFVAHEESATFGVGGMLVRVDDIGVLLVQKTTGCGDDTGLVGAGDEQSDGAFF